MVAGNVVSRVMESIRWKSDENSAASEENMSIEVSICANKSFGLKTYPMSADALVS